MQTSHVWHGRGFKTQDWLKHLHYSYTKHEWYGHGSLKQSKNSPKQGQNHAGAKLKYARTMSQDIMHIKLVSKICSTSIWSMQKMTKPEKDSHDMPNDDQIHAEMDWT